MEEFRRYYLSKNLRNTLMRKIPTFFKSSVLNFLCRLGMVVENYSIEKASFNSVRIIAIWSAKVQMIALIKQKIDDYGN